MIAIVQHLAIVNCICIIAIAINCDVLLTTPKKDFRQLVLVENLLPSFISKPHERAGQSYNTLTWPEMPEMMKAHTYFFAIL